MIFAAADIIDTSSRLVSLSEHQLLVFWVQLLVIVATARFAGYLMFRVGLPSVIGYLAAGLVLGPSVFGKVWPDGFHWFIPESDISSGALVAVTWLGVALLLVTAGFETDLDLIRRLGKAAMLVTGFSLVVPLVGGLIVGLVLPDVFVGVGADGVGADRNVFAMFIAAALSVSALAVIARILSELGLMRRDFGQITVAAGMANDVVGWVMLAVFAGFATGGVSVSGTLRTVLGMAMFLVVSMTLGQKAVDYCLREVRRFGGNVPGAVSVAVFTMLIFGVATQWLGIEAVLGAFVAGVVLNRSRFQQHEVIEHIESLTNSFLAPIFFALAGMRVDLALLADGEAMVWAVTVVFVAIVAKFLGSFVGAKLAGQTSRAATALGAGLNARGALEIVIASVGLGTGVFSDTAYTVVVIMPLITSIFAAVSLRIVVRDWRGSEDEQERMDREKALERNLMVRSERLLLASRSGPASISASEILHFAWPEEVPTTVISVDDSVDANGVSKSASGKSVEKSRAARGTRVGTGVPPDITVIRNVLHERVVDHRIVKAEGAAEAIVSESKLGYGVICVGVATHHEGQLYSPMVDELLLRSTLPVLIVRRARGIATALPGAFGRAIVPVTGTRSSRAAQEIAFGLSRRLGTEIVLTHVVTRDEILFPRTLLGKRSAARDKDGAVLRDRARDNTRDSTRGDRGRSVLTQSEVDMNAVDPVVESLMSSACDLGAEMNISPVTHVRESVSPGSALVQSVKDYNADVIVLGASLRNVDGRPFLGQTVETVLESCDANVVVAVMPRAVRHT